MQTSLLEKARAGRRAALSALNARIAPDDRVVSIFEGTFPRRQAVPLFHSVRAAPATARDRKLPTLILDNRVAA